MISPLSLYIHIPWCVKKCPYCDFNSHQPKAPIDQTLELQYIDALILDLEQSLGIQNNARKIHSVFIGGGTPSLFSATSIEILLNKINKLLNIPNGTEITLEANPGTFEANKFRDFKLAGINRLSIGVQSFDNYSLKLLGRIHDSEQAKKAIIAARGLGYNFNIDLMHSLPEQSTNLALADINQAISGEPSHISWYQLTIEPNTKFAKHTPTLPNQDIQDSIYYKGLELLQEHHYQQYEISAFCRDNKKSQHNLNYWRYGDYLGIGAGAHSKLTLDNKIIRQWKQKSPARYLDNTVTKISGSSELTNKEVLLEYMMNKLRILEPITEQEFYNATQLKFLDIMDTIMQAQNHSWLDFQQNKLVITDLGRKFLNDLILLFA